MERKGSAKGFTLIELMVTVIILTVGIMGIMSALGNGIDDIRRIRNTSTAANILQERMEIVRNTAFSSVSDVTWTDIDDSRGLNNGRWKVDVVENYQDQDKIKQVTVTVTWILSEASVSRSLTTLVTFWGINP